MSIRVPRVASCRGVQCYCTKTGNNCATAIISDTGVWENRGQTATGVSRLARFGSIRDRRTASESDGL